MKVWSTKYALTTGIEEVETEVCIDMMTKAPTDMVKIQSAPGSYSCYLHGEGKDWHRTEQAALERALDLVEKKAESIRKSLKKLDMSETSFRNRLEALRSKTK